MRCNGFSNLQLQSGITGALGHHERFAARSHAKAICRNRLQTRIVGASWQIDQRSRSADNGYNSALLRERQFLRSFL